MRLLFLHQQFKKRLNVSFPLKSSIYEMFLMFLVVIGFWLALVCLFVETQPHVDQVNF